MFYLIRKKKNLLQLVIKKQVFSYKNFLSSPSLHKDRFYTRSVELQYLIFEKSNKDENEKKS